MSSRYFLVLLVLLATACKKNETPSGLTSGKNAPAESAKELTPAETEAAKIKAAEMAEAARIKAESEAAAARLAEAKKKHASLESKLDAAMKDYTKTLRNAKTREARTAAMEANPIKELGGEFVSFAREYDGTDQAYEALKLMTSRGLGDSKTEAMTMLLEIIEADPEDSRAYETLSLITMRGSGEPKSNAMSKLLATTESEPDSEESYKTLSLIAFTRGEDESKTKAIEQLLASVEANPNTDRAIDCLALFATRGEDDYKANAIGDLIENHVNHDKMIDVIKAMSRGLPARQTEQWLQQISEAAVAGKVKGNAIITRISMLNRLKSFKSFLASADEEQLKSFDQEMIEYVNAERDADESKNLEELLETFIKDHSDVLKKAERELYAMQHLSVGCEAPEIAGIDLDGKEFSLSDYRGKVVFLDFWGDW